MGAEEPPVPRLLEAVPKRMPRQETATRVVWGGYGSHGARGGRDGRHERKRDSKRVLKVLRYTADALELEVDAKAKNYHWVH